MLLEAVAVAGANVTQQAVAREVGMEKLELPPQSSTLPLTGLHSLCLLLSLLGLLRCLFFLLLLLMATL